jgi:hypothetical protein
MSSLIRLFPAKERITIMPMKKAMGPILCLLSVILLFGCLSETNPAFGAVKKAARQPAKSKKAIKIDKTPPRFIYHPTVVPAFVSTPDNLPILTFSANKDVSVEVEPWMGNGRQRLTGDILAATNLKKGVKLDVPWTVSILSNGKFNFHITMTDKDGHRAEFNAPFQVYFMDNRNRSVVH